MKPTTILLNYFHTTSFLHRAEKFVELLNSPSLGPTVCDTDDPPKLFFDGPAILTKMVRAREQGDPAKVFADRWLIRDVTPRWEGHISLRWTQFEFAAVKPSKWAEIFAWSHEIAEVLQPDFGTCHRLRQPKECLYSNWSGLSMRRDFERCGLPWLGDRTFLSHRIVSRIGLERLQKSGVEHLEVLGWGIALDLCKNPWAINPADLCKQYPSIMKTLTPSGIFGDYGEVLHKAKPGPDWTKEIIE